MPAHADLGARMLWYWALGRSGIARVSLPQFLQPISGMLLAWLLLGQRLSSSALFASILILLDIAIAAVGTENIKRDNL